MGLHITILYYIKRQIKKLLIGIVKGVTDMVKWKGGRYVFPRSKRVKEYKRPRSVGLPILQHSVELHFNKIVKSSVFH